MFKEVDLWETPRHMASHHRPNTCVKPMIFFQLNFTIIFGIFNLKGGYALLIIKLIIKAEWVVLNVENL
jgi:hypothetical protein